MDIKDVRMCKVKDLIVLLGKINGEWFVVANTLGNLSLIKKAPDGDSHDYIYVGFVELKWGELEIFDDGKKHLSYHIEDGEVIKKSESE